MIATSGSRVKSKGITILAGANESDLVRHKWALSPAIPITINQDTLPADGIVILPSYPAHRRPKIICRLVKKNKIFVRESVSVSLRVNIADAAKPMAEIAAAIIPIFSAPISGFATINTPTKPNIAINIFLNVSLSPKNIGAKITTHIGDVNSKANNCASGIIGRAKNHRFCPIK